MKAANSLTRLKIFQINSKKSQIELLNKTLKRFEQKAEQLLLHIQEQEKKYGHFEPEHYAYPPSAKSAAIRHAKLLVSIEELREQNKALVAEIEALQLEVEKIQQRTFEKMPTANYKTA